MASSLPIDVQCAYTHTRRMNLCIFLLCAPYGIRSSCENCCESIEQQNLKHIFELRKWHLFSYSSFLLMLLLFHLFLAFRRLQTFGLMCDTCESNRNGRGKLSSVWFWPNANRTSTQSGIAVQQRAVGPILAKHVTLISLPSEFVATFGILSRFHRCV